MLLLLLLSSLFIFLVLFKFKDFTTDPVKFPGLLMEQFVNELHDKGMHYGKIGMTT